MDTETTVQQQQRAQFNLRRLIRYSFGAQVAVVAIVLSITLYGALQTTKSSDELKNTSSNVLLFRGVQQEFDRSRASLREYVITRNAFRLGPFTQSRGQIALIGATLGTTLDPASHVLLDDYTAKVSGYLAQVGDIAVREVQTGEAPAALKLLDQPESVDRLRRITRSGTTLQSHLVGIQRDAEGAVSRRQTTNVVLIVAAGLLVLGAGFGLLVWIRREMMLPLDDLAMASRKLGHGDLTARVDPRGVNEIAVAGAAFNQMADEIEQHVGQLHELSVARSRFVSSVSHELRTPITSLRGYLELLVQGEAGDLQADQKHYVEIAERNARQLDELINDLLTLSRVQSGRITLKPQAIDIRALLRELKAEMLPIATERHVELVLVDTGDLFVSGDPLRLKQAFGNLISNAIKYSEDGQSVVVRAFRVNRQVVVSFVDWGMGIPKDELPQIAEPFFRSASTERIPGTGLGLAIAKQMIELHGGRLAVESEHGAGSTFTAYLPLRTEAVESRDDEGAMPPLGEDPGEPSSNGAGDGSLQIPADQDVDRLPPSPAS
ncbi:MAG: ATP-binding protein [Solirubrobacterales bacterium]